MNHSIIQFIQYGFSKLHTLKRISIFFSIRGGLLNFTKLCKIYIVPIALRNRKPSFESISKLSNTIYFSVSLMQSIQSHQERERQKQLLEARHRAELQQKADEAERERIRAEKKAAKERRRREREEREEAGRKKAELEAMLAQRQEMQQRKNANVSDLIWCEKKFRRQETENNFSFFKKYRR